MPGSYCIDLERRVVFSRGWGVLTNREMEVHARALKSDARFDPTLSQVLDFTDVTQFSSGPVGIQGLASINPFRLDARRAVVVSSMLVFGLVRQYQGFTEIDPGYLRLFPVMTEALVWLGLDPATPWPDRVDWTTPTPGDRDAG